MADRKGFLTTLTESFRSHFDDRLKSPFAGAFAAAWLLFNWKGILVLFFSSSSIEDRISTVVNDHFSAGSTIWNPLWAAFAIAISAYFLSTLFLALRELYGVGARWVERAFDNVRWKSPAEYIGLKTEKNREIERLQSLAADKLDDLNAERARANELNAKVIEIQEQNSALNLSLQSTLEQLAVAREQSDGFRQILSAASEQNQRNFEAEKLIGQVRDYAKVEIAKSLTSPASTLRSNEVVKNIYKMLRRAPISAQVESVRPSAEELAAFEVELEAFTLSKYPGLAVDRKLQKRLVSDIARSNLWREVYPLALLDAVLIRAQQFLEDYSRKKPEVFKTGTDYITKALGLTFPAFQKAHGFSRTTINEFAKYR